jgi:hypothetical protein
MFTFSFSSNRLPDIYTFLSFIIPYYFEFFSECHKRCAICVEILLNLKLLIKLESLNVCNKLRVSKKFSTDLVGCIYSLSETKGHNFPLPLPRNGVSMTVFLISPP